MTLQEAKIVIDGQRRAFRKLNNLRFIHGEYEYRLQYEGGLAEFFRLDRREIWKRNFKYFTGFGAWEAPDCHTVLRFIEEALANRKQ